MCKCGKGENCCKKQLERFTAYIKTHYDPTGISRRLTDLIKNNPQEIERIKDECRQVALKMTIEKEKKHHDDARS